MQFIVFPLHSVIVLYFMYVFLPGRCQSFVLRVVREGAPYFDAECGRTVMIRIVIFTAVAMLAATVTVLLFCSKIRGALINSFIFMLMLYYNYKRIDNIINENNSCSDLFMEFLFTGNVATTEVCIQTSFSP